jgi:hypothetical protein
MSEPNPSGAGIQCSAKASQEATSTQRTGSIIMIWAFVLICDVPKYKELVSEDGREQAGSPVGMRVGARSEE